jgi:hypothetical protein
MWEGRGVGKTLLGGLVGSSFEMSNYVVIPTWLDGHPLRQCGFRLAQAPCCARDQVQDQAADCAEQIRAALLAVVGLSPVRYFERAGRCGPPGEAAGRGCWGDRAVHLMPAGQVVYHGVPPPNAGRIIALST